MKGSSEMKKQTATVAATIAILFLGACSSPSNPAEPTLFDTGVPAKYEHSLAYERRNEILAEQANGTDISGPLATLCKEISAYAISDTDGSWLAGCNNPNASWNPYSESWN
jgi:hypothetical protein